MIEEIHRKSHLLCVNFGRRSKSDLGFGGRNPLYRYFFKSASYTCPCDLGLSGFQKGFIVFERTFVNTKARAIKGLGTSGLSLNCRI